VNLSPLPLTPPMKIMNMFVDHKSFQWYFCIISAIKMDILWNKYRLNWKGRQDGAEIQYKVSRYRYSCSSILYRNHNIMLLLYSNSSGVDLFYKVLVLYCTRRKVCTKYKSILHYIALLSRTMPGFRAYTSHHVFMSCRLRSSDRQKFGEFFKLLILVGF
jgi:hypothetical protein